MPPSLDDHGLARCRLTCRHLVPPPSPTQALRDIAHPWQLHRQRFAHQYPAPFGVLCTGDAGFSSPRLLRSPLSALPELRSPLSALPFATQRVALCSVLFKQQTTSLSDAPPPASRRLSRSPLALEMNACSIYGPGKCASNYFKYLDDSTEICDH
jgi:hypothetical protein